MKSLYLYIPMYIYCEKFQSKYVSVLLYWLSFVIWEWMCEWNRCINKCYANLIYFSQNYQKMINGNELIGGIIEENGNVCHG